MTIAMGHKIEVPRAVLIFWSDTQPHYFSDVNTYYYKLIP